MTSYNNARLPRIHFIFLATSLLWGIAAILYQATINWFPYPSGYGLNLASVIWFAWSFPVVMGIIFGPFALTFLLLRHWKSPFFAKPSVMVESQ